MCPGGAVVGDAVAAVVGGNEGLLLASVEFTLAWVDSVDVLRFCAFVGDNGAISVRDRVASHSIPCWTVKTYTCKTLGTGEDYFAFGIIPGVILVLLEHGELDGVNHLQVLKA